MFKQIVLATAAALAIAALTGCAASAPAASSASSEQSVAAAAEKLRVAMIDPTPTALAQLVADDLSYGHSGGRVDTKDSFIGDLIAGKSDFVTIAISDQTIKVVGNTAIVRHTLTADTNDSGKPGKVQIKILGVWQQQGDQWKLLARQAVRVAA
ncbi:MULTISPECIES: nuclear transport factor 2 family protein [unclassified Acidovorax]|uniref:nuclear transport factor 2 family protein n=1 Tax=unclassified Acidovorax TaxID=2684926 RepID=UPI001C46C634|nr:MULTISPECIES: nuclear transport factor 2 family protein [unclassified Acidovorax]MBV7426604.1 nuclear transport factor 2 family protein [Acidovorax sp. sif0732]MBV7447729.1 nuclear transport factor 2 family protein [Acidovorax sp. sif0715]